MIRAFALAAATVTLAGCSILSEPEPVNLYRFGDTDPPLTAARATRTALVLNPIEFPQGAGGDRILTATGGQVAYLAGARWIGPSESLYHSALQAEFLRSGHSVIISDRREAARNGLALDLNVTSFEARYLNGHDTPPTVVVAGRARLVAPDRTVRAERTFTIQQPATANRVSSVVDAFDIATAAFNRDIVAWVDASVE